MKKAIGLVSALVAVFALAGWQGSASAAQTKKEGAGGGVEATIMKLNDRITQAALKGDAATFRWRKAALPTREQAIPRVYA